MKPKNSNTSQTIKTLMNDIYAPITSKVGFLEAPLERVGKVFHEWWASLSSPNVVHTKQIHSPFPVSLHELEPLMIGYRKRALFLKTDSSWIAYFDNCDGGTDPDGPMGVLCDWLHCRGLILESIPDTITGTDDPGRYGSIGFSQFSPQPTNFLNYLRSIQVMHDFDKWEFIVTGTPQPFEDIERYKARRIRDRFTTDMLDEYAQALGIRYFDPEFYQGTGLLIEDRTPVPSEDTILLKEAQRRLGIKL